MNKKEQLIKKIIKNWVKTNYGESELREPSWNINYLSTHIKDNLNVSKKFRDVIRTVIKTYMSDIEYYINNDISFSIDKMEQDMYMSLIEEINKVL